MSMAHIVAIIFALVAGVALLVAGMEFHEFSTTFFAEVEK